VQLRSNLFLFLLITFSLNAQASVRGFGDGTISVKPFVDNPSYKVQILPKVDTNGRKQVMRPHIHQQVGVDLSTSIIGIGFATRVPTPEDQKLLKGETDYQDYRFSLAFPSLFISLNAQRYVGFFIENSSSIDPTTGGSNPYIRLPNLELTNASLGATYTFSPETFSLKAAWDQTVRQTESGGSWLAGGYVGDTRFTDTQPIITSQIRSDFGSEQNIREGRFTSVILRGGYGHTFVLAQKWFLSLTGLIGYGPTFGKTFDGTLNREISTTGVHGDALISLGFNGDNFFAGFFASGGTVSYQTESLNISTEVALGRLYLGMRF
jgi:hypothetical protein